MSCKNNNYPCLPVKGESFPVNILSKGTTSKPAIWSSSSSVPTAISSVQTPLNVLGNWAPTWRLPLKCEASFFSTYTSEASAPCSICQTTNFLSTPLLSFSVFFYQIFVLLKHRSFIKAKFFPHLKALRSIASASCWSPSMHSLFPLVQGVHSSGPHLRCAWLISFLFPKTNQDGV